MSLLVVLVRLRVGNVSLVTGLESISLVSVLKNSTSVFESLRGVVAQESVPVSLMSVWVKKACWLWFLTCQSLLVKLFGEGRIICNRVRGGGFYVEERK